MILHSSIRTSDANLKKKEEGRMYVILFFLVLLGAGLGEMLIVSSILEVVDSPNSPKKIRIIKMVIGVAVMSICLYILLRYILFFSPFVLCCF